MTEIATNISMTSGRWWRPASGASVLVGWIAVLATLATDAVSLLPAVRFAYHAPALHVALETAAALVAALAAYLAVGRFRRSRLLSDLLLAAALAVLALSNAFTAVVPSSAESPAATALVWLATSVGAAGACVFACSALLGGQRVQDVRRGERRAAAVVVLGVGALAIAAFLARGMLPLAVEPGLDPSGSQRPQLVGHPSMLILQLLALSLFTIAAVGFTRSSAQTGDRFLCWLAIAAVLGAAARANYMLYPSLYSDWVYTGDAFRLLFYVVILVAVAQQMRAHWERAADAAVLEERRRIARDLHDGLAQELGYVLRNARRLEPDDLIAGRIAGGVARALDESRRAIAALTEPLDEPLDVALTRVAHDAARRAGTNVRVDVEPGIEVTRDEREALARIAAEAVANAGRHAGVPYVLLSCTNGGPERLRLQVADAGKGFDPNATDARSSGGFGLVSMRERAARIGAELTVESQPGVGTTVEVTL